jgi:hypothetical protein
MATLWLQNFQNSAIQDEICQIVMAKHRFFKVGINWNKLYVIWGWTHVKALLGNAGDNEENNCKPDHNWVVPRILGHPVWTYLFKIFQVGIVQFYIIELSSFKFINTVWNRMIFI